MFTVLLFGLSTACYVFTKLLRPLVRIWRSTGIKVVMYIDDGIIVAPTVSKTTSESKCIWESLHRPGFVINKEKSNWEPSQSGLWLGFKIDLGKGTLAIPIEKTAQLKDMIANTQQSSTIMPKTLASIVGRIVGPVHY